jgi:hypothetical protein
VHVVGGSIILYGQGEHYIGNSSFHNTVFGGEGGQACELHNVKLTCESGITLFKDGGVYTIYTENPATAIPAGAIIEPGTTVNVVQILPPYATATPAGTQVSLSRPSSYHFTSGTFTVDTNGRAAGAVATVLVAAGVALPAALSSAPFVLPPASGGNDPTKERLVTLQVLRDLRILTTITPLA